LLTDLPPPEAPRRQWPFGEMAVNTSFRVPAPDERKAVQAMRAWAHRNPGATFRSGRDPEGFLRIWRLT
jgi:hypothetical protein